MPERSTIEHARQLKREGKSPTTQAGEFVHEEIEHIRQGKHGARSAKQAIAIGLAKARRAGVDLPPPPDTASERTKRDAERASRAPARTRTRKSPARSRAALEKLKGESRTAASHTALSRHARSVARRKAREGASTRASATKKR